MCGCKNNGNNVRMRVIKQEMVFKTQKDATVKKVEIPQKKVLKIFI